MLLKTPEELYRPRHFGFTDEFDLLQMAGRERGVVARKLAVRAGRALGRWFRRLSTTLRGWTRIDLSSDQLSRLDDRTLADIGLTRSDLFIAAHRTRKRHPVSVDRCAREPAQEPAQENDIPSQAA